MPTDVRPVTIPDFAAWKSQRRRISMLTAYDFPTARLLDGAGVDCLLVGDSLGTVVQGWETTLRVTLDQIIYHAEMVARAARRALVVADLPFLSYQVSPRQALRSAGRILKETNCQAVKLEGGAGMAATIRALVDAGIPVMGHVGLQPQAVRRLGGYKVQRSGERDPRRRPGRRPTPGPSPSSSNASPAASPPGSPSSCPSRPSASAPARIATARSSSSTTCSG